MPATLCRYVRTTGRQCQSPALQSERFCYYHTALSKRHRYFRPNQQTDPLFERGKHIRLDAIDDRDSLQMALSQTVGAIATGQIERKSGVAILYGLQLIAQNIAHREANPASTPEAQISAVIKSFDHLDLAPAISEPSLIEAHPARLENPDWAELD